jgi:hypothetical protein
MEPNHLRKLLHALETSGARYLIVGGLAVVFHGHLRFNADVDIVPSFDLTDLQKLLNALSFIGFRPRAPIAFDDFMDPEKRRIWIEEKNLMVLSLWNPDMPATGVNLFVEAPFSFDEVYARALITDEEACTVSVIGLDDLIELKKNAGRQQDQLDVAALEAIRKELNQKREA